MKTDIGLKLRQALALSAAGLAIAAVAGAAQAQERRGRGEPPPLTVQKRSFLDMGAVVPVDSMQNYVLIGTKLNEPVYYNQRGLLGLETLPQRFEVPGRPRPLFEF